MEPWVGSEKCTISDETAGAKWQLPSVGYAEASFRLYMGSDAQVAKIRSRSARYRCISDMKSSGAAHQVGKDFSRIAIDKVYEQYSKLNHQQLREGLRRFTELQRTWEDI